MRAPIRKSLRKWMIGAGSTLSVALMLQHVKNTDAYQAVVAQSNGNDGSSIQQQQKEPSSQDPVFQEWQNQNGQDSGGGFGRHFRGSSSGSFGNSDSGGGFSSRSGPS